jgi:C1A family cysteine protease
MLTIEEIKSAIADRARDSWTAAETDIWRRLSVEGEADGLFGLRIGSDAGRLEAAEDALENFGAPQLPPRIDWRYDSGGRLSTIRDQGLDCGACVSFATIAAVEATHWINTGNQLELSEADLFHCNGGDCNHGWGLAAGLAAALSGVTSRTEAPWSADAGCLGKDAVVRVTRYVERNSADARKQALVNGPVLGGMKVYEDFSAYAGGVYKKVIGGFRGNHAICVVGYDDTEGCWVARNSWGAGWGQGGYFKIAYGECDIDMLPFYSCETEAL